MTEDQFRTELLETLREGVRGDDGAFKFLMAYFNYSHGIDDLVDEPKSVDTIRKTTLLMEMALSSDFYRRNADALWPVIQMVHFQYFISVEFEQAPESWKRKHADVLRHCGNAVAMAVIALYQEESGVIEIGKKLIELSHRYHHDFQEEDVA